MLSGKVKRLALKLALALALTCSRSAWATPSAKLAYSRGPGAETCPDEDQLRKAVAARLGYDPFFPWANKTIEAEITHTKRGFHGEVKVIDAAGLLRGARSIDAASQDCGDMVRAVALAISIALDDLALDEPSSPSAAPSPAPAPEPTPAPPPTPAPEPTPTPPATPTPAKPKRFAPDLWLAPVVTFGTAPAPAVGFHLDLRLSTGIVSLDLEAQADLPASGGASVAATTPGNPAEVRTYLVLGSLVPCLRLPLTLSVAGTTTLYFLGCALLTAGVFEESGVDVAVSSTGNAPFLAAGGRLGLEVPLSSRFFLLAHGDAFGILLRHTVLIDQEPVFTLPALGGRLGVGGGVRF
jgi:hypothetical protein